MQNKKEQSQQKMMLLPSMESFIPEDYRLRKLNRVLDLSFVHDSVRGLYCPDNGRPSIDPEVVIRLFLLQAIEGISSVRELMREVQVNLAYRWFIGYSLDERLPDHSTSSKALDRFGDEVFNNLFERSVAQCQASGLIEGKVLHVDATTIRADLDINKVNQVGSADPDARFGHFPDGKPRPGYKQHVAVDGRARVVVGMEVSPANYAEEKGVVAMVDQVTERLGTAPEAICADGVYGSGRNRAALEARGIRFVSPPLKATTPVKGEYFTVEDFVYDNDKDVFICPGGSTLICVGRESGRPDRRRYRASRKDCRTCSLKGQCTPSSYRRINVGKNHAAMVRLRADSKTESFKQLYRMRAPTVEGVFAEEKCWHGMRRAWRRGLLKMRIQCALVAAVINFKRLITTTISLLAGNKTNLISVFAILCQKFRMIYKYLCPKTKIFMPVA